MQSRLNQAEMVAERILVVALEETMVVEIFV